MSLREDRIKRRLKQLRVEGKEYKALAPVGRPLPVNADSVTTRANKAWNRSLRDNGKGFERDDYVPLSEREDWDGVVEVIKEK